LIHGCHAGRFENVFRNQEMTVIRRFHICSFFNKYTGSDFIICIEFYKIDS
jgi:hypothetical protein